MRADPAGVARVLAICQRMDSTGMVVMPRIPPGSWEVPAPAENCHEKFLYHLGSADQFRIKWVLRGP
jgi:hypothetical protein